MNAAGAIRIARAKAELVFEGAADGVAVIEAPAGNVGAIKVAGVYSWSQQQGKAMVVRIVDPDRVLREVPAAFNAAQTLDAERRAERIQRVVCIAFSDEGENRGRPCRRRRPQPGSSHI